MKKLAAIFVFALTTLILLADTNVLQLVWTQPPGYTSQLYTATNLTGTWTALTVPSNQPPVSVTVTQSQVFFYVTVTPNTRFAGANDPTNDAVSGSTFVNTNTGDIWFNISGGTNGWVWEIAGQ